MKFNKLVRDNIVEMMLDDGYTVKYRKLWGKALTNALLDKLNEEVEELESAFNSGCTKSIINEMADVLTVLDALRENLDITLCDIIDEIDRWNIKDAYKLRPDIIHDIKINISTLERKLGNGEKKLILTLADIQLSVLEVLRRRYIDKHTVLKYKDKKVAKKGGFKKGIYLIEVVK